MSILGRQAVSKVYELYSLLFINPHSVDLSSYRCIEYSVTILLYLYRLQYCGVTGLKKLEGSQCCI